MLQKRKEKQRNKSKIADELLIMVEIAIKMFRINQLFR